MPSDQGGLWADESIEPLGPAQRIKQLLPHYVGPSSYAFLSSGGLAKINAILSESPRWESTASLTSESEDMIPSSILFLIADFLAAAFVEPSETSTGTTVPTPDRPRIASYHSASMHTAAVHRACVEGAACYLLLAATVAYFGECCVQRDELLLVLSAVFRGTPLHLVDTTVSDGASSTGSRPPTAGGLQHPPSTNPPPAPQGGSFGSPHGSSAATPSASLVAQRLVNEQPEWTLPNSDERPLAYLVAYLTAETMVSAIAKSVVVSPRIADALGAFMAKTVDMQTTAAEVDHTQPVAASVRPTSRARAASRGTRVGAHRPPSGTLGASVDPDSFLANTSGVMPSMSDGSSAVAVGVDAGPTGLSGANSGTVVDEAAAVSQYGVQATAVAAAAVALSLSSSRDTLILFAEMCVESVALELAVHLAKKADGISVLAGGSSQTIGSRSLTLAVAPPRVATGVGVCKGLSAQRGALPEVLSDPSRPVMVGVNGVCYPDACALLGTALAAGLAQVILCDPPRPLACCEVLRASCVSSAIDAVWSVLRHSVVTGEGSHSHVHSHNHRGGGERRPSHSRANGAPSSAAVDGSMSAATAGGGTDVRRGGGVHDRRPLRGARRDHHPEKDPAVASQLLLSVAPLVHLLVDITPPPVCVEMLRASPTASVSEAISKIDALCVGLLGVLPKCVPVTGMIAQPVGWLMSLAARRLASVAVRALSLRGDNVSTAPVRMRVLNSNLVAGSAGGGVEGSMSLSGGASNPATASFVGGPFGRKTPLLLCLDELHSFGVVEFVGGPVAHRSDLRWVGRAPYDAPHEAKLPAGFRSVPWNLLTRCIARLPAASGAVNCLRMCVQALAVLPQPPYEADEVFKDVAASQLAPGGSALARLLPEPPQVPERAVAPDPDQSPRFHRVSSVASLAGAEQSVPQRVAALTPAREPTPAVSPSTNADVLPIPLPFASSVLCAFSQCGRETARLIWLQQIQSPSSRRRAQAPHSTHPPQSASVSASAQPPPAVTSPTSETEGGVKSPSAPGEEESYSAAGAVAVADAPPVECSQRGKVPPWIGDFAVFGCDPVLRSLLLAQLWRESEQKAARDVATAAGRVQTFRSGVCADFHRLSAQRRQGVRDAMLQQHNAELTALLRAHEEQRAAAEADFLARAAELESQIAAARALEGLDEGGGGGRRGGARTPPRSRNVSRVRRRSPTVSPSGQSEHGFPSGKTSEEGSPATSSTNERWETTESLSGAVQSKTHVLTLLQTLRDLSDEKDVSQRAQRSAQLDEVRRLEQTQQEQLASVGSNAAAEIENDICTAEGLCLWAGMEHALACARQNLYVTAAATADALSCVCARHVCDIQASASEAWRGAERAWTSLLRCVDVLHSRRSDALGAHPDSAVLRMESGTEEMAEVVLRIEREAASHLSAWCTEASIFECLEAPLMLDRLAEQVTACAAVLTTAEEALRMGRSAAQAHLTNQSSRSALEATAGPAVPRKMNSTFAMSMRGSMHGGAAGSSRGEDEVLSSPGGRARSFSRRRGSTIQVAPPTNFGELLLRAETPVRECVSALESSYRGVLVEQFAREAQVIFIRMGAELMLAEYSRRSGLQSQESAEWFALLRRHLDAVRVLGGIYALPTAVAAVRAAIVSEELFVRESWARQALVDVEEIQRSWVVWGSMHRAHADRLPYLRPSTAGAKPDVTAALLLSTAYARPLVRNRASPQMVESPKVRLPSPHSARRRTPLLSPLPLSAATLAHRTPLPSYMYADAQKEYQRVAADTALSMRHGIMGASGLHRVIKKELHMMRKAEALSRGSVLAPEDTV